LLIHFGGKTGRYLLAVVRGLLFREALPGRSLIVSVDKIVVVLTALSTAPE
jgi:hypothetical protein